MVKNNKKTNKKTLVLGKQKKTQTPQELTRLGSALRALGGLGGGL